MRAVVFAGAGGNEVIRLEERPDPVPGSEELLVRVTHAGLNPADLSQREGSYPAPPGSPQDIPGLEVAGTVEACGAQVLDWKPGDRVFGLVGGGGLADRVVVHQRCVGAPCRTRSTSRARPAVPEAFITAHDAIRSQAALSPGETLLVHGAAGGVGSAALQIGAVCGSRVLGSGAQRRCGRARARARRRADRRRGLRRQRAGGHRRAWRGRHPRARRRAALPRQPARRRHARADRGRRAWAPAPRSRSCCAS